MRTTGMVRRIDELGRVVIPKELRRELNLNKKDLMEIFVDGGLIIFQKYEGKCTLCRSTHNLINFGGRKICSSCIQSIKNGNMN